MSYPYYHQVQRAHSELITEGKIRPRTNQEEVEQDKGLLTRRAAYYVNTENDPNHGILEKKTGNNSMGYSTDLIPHKDGRFWDVATDRGEEGGPRMAEPVDGGENGPFDDIPPKWKQPTAELAQLDETPNLPNNPPSSQEYNEKLDQIIETLGQVQTQAAENTGSIIAVVNYNTDKILERIDDIKDQAEETLKKFLVLWMARQEDGGETPEPPDGEPPNQLLLLLLKALGNRPEISQERKK